MDPSLNRRPRKGQNGSSSPCTLRQLDFRLQVPLGSICRSTSQLTKPNMVYNASPLPVRDWSENSINQREREVGRSRHKASSDRQRPSTAAVSALRPLSWHCLVSLLEKDLLSLCVHNRFYLLTESCNFPSCFSIKKTPVSSESPQPQLASLTACSEIKSPA